MKTITNFWDLFKLTFAQELKLAFRHAIEITAPLLFFILIICLYPFAVSPDVKVMELLAPGIIWIAVLLSLLLGVERLFRADLQDGSLEQILLSPQPLGIIIFAKLFAQWCICALPLILLAPLLGTMLHLKTHSLNILFLSLLFGTPTLVFLGGLGRALTLHTRNNGLLIFILIIPFYIPVLIFGAGSVVVADEGFTVIAQLCWLTVLTILAIPFGTWATTAALRVGVIQ